MSVLLMEGFESGDKQDSDSMMPVLLNMIVEVEGSVHVWGGITAFNKTVCAQKKSYINNVLRPMVVPFMQRHLPRGIYQQDNARAQTAGASMNFLNQNGINVLEWPFSPDVAY